MTPGRTNLNWIRSIHIARLEKAEYRKFGIITGAIIAFLFGLFLPWLFFDNYPSWQLTPVSVPFIIFYVLSIWALLLPSTLVVVYIPWMYFATILGLINSRIILGILYFLMFTPFAIVLKILGKDLMERKLDPTKESYWREVEAREPEHVERNY